MKKNITNEIDIFINIIWDQIILSLVFTFLIFLMPEDYNMDVKKEDPLLKRFLHSWHFSIVTQYTIGYGYVYPITTRGQIINSILYYYVLLTCKGFESKFVLNF